MANTVITGMEEALAKLRKLDAALQTTITRAGLKAGAEVVLEEAEETSPEKTGLMKSNLKVWGGKVMKKYGSMRVSVGIGQKWWSGPAFYGAFVVLGHRRGSRVGPNMVRGKSHSRSHMVHEKVQNRDWVTGRDFIKAAGTTKASQAAQAVADTIMRGVEQQLKG